MNKRIRKKQEKKRKQAWKRLREQMNHPDFWKRADPTGWSTASDGATWWTTTRFAGTTAVLADDQGG